MGDRRFYEGPESGVPFILRSGQSSFPLGFIMLHGWGGDERVMWVLESVLPEGAPVVTLRGLYPLSGEDGFQWTRQPATIENTTEDFAEAVEAIGETLDILDTRHGFDPDRLVLMGFSQGAALSFALAEYLDPAPRAIIALAGYRPTIPSFSVKDVPIFWGHGIQDELVPVERARKDVAELRSKGAEVHYCETDVGHKLGIECTRGLKLWLEDLAGADA